MHLLWRNQPAVLETRENGLQMEVEAGTDFWRMTEDGGIRDNGHFGYQAVTGDWVAEVRVSGRYRDLYDQAGLMVRQDETTWLKCGIEYVEGVQQASVVVTRDYSDWSVLPLSQNPESIFLRVRRTGGTVQVFYSLDGVAYTMIRTGYLTSRPDLRVGLMAAAPRGKGFPVRFEGFSIRPV